eukprot:15577623-Heterocapsa_arctica.AAC.1
MSAISFFIFLQLQESSELASTFVDFAQRLISAERSTYLDFWVAERVGEGAYDAADDATMQQALYLFDAMYAAQYAVCAATEAYGKSFTGAQFLEQLAVVDIQLTTGRWALDANAKRIP